MDVTLFCNDYIYKKFGTLKCEGIKSDTICQLFRNLSNRYGIALCFHFNISIFNNYIYSDNDVRLLRLLLILFVGLNVNNNPKSLA